MASIKCSCCGNAIHYHDEPDGTQFIAFSKNTWDKLTASDLWISRYVLDTAEKYFIVWKCKECGALHVFDADSPQLNSVYTKSDAPGVLPLQTDEYIAFSDYEWEKITEERIRGCNLHSLHPSLKMIRSFSDGDALYVAADKSGMMCTYKKLGNT